MASFYYDLLALLLVLSFWGFDHYLFLCGQCKKRIEYYLCYHPTRLYYSSIGQANEEGPDSEAEIRERNQRTRFLVKIEIDFLPCGFFHWVFNAPNEQLFTVS